MMRKQKADCVVRSAFLLWGRMHVLRRNGTLRTPLPLPMLLRPEIDLPSDVGRNHASFAAAAFTRSLRASGMV